MAVLQICLKLLQAQRYTSLALYIKCQLLMIFSSSFIGESDLPVFAQPVVYLNFLVLKNDKLK